MLIKVMDTNINTNFRKGLLSAKPKNIKIPKYDKKITKKKEALPYTIIKILEKIAPQKPKKFVISDFPINLPIPGSFGL